MQINLAEMFAETLWHGHADQKFFQPVYVFVRTLKDMYGETQAIPLACTVRCLVF